MLKAEQIPDEVVEATAIVLMGRLMVSHQDALHVWSGIYEPEKEQFRREARASIAVALEEAAKVVEFSPDSHTAREMQLMLDKAAAIRAMIKEPT